MILGSHWVDYILWPAKLWPLWFKRLYLILWPIALPIHAAVIVTLFTTASARCACKNAKNLWKGN